MKRTLSAVVALLASLFIYAFYRSEKTVVNELIISLVSFDSYLSFKQKMLGYLPLTESVIYSLPGGLWVYCATVLSQRFYIRGLGKEIQVSAAPVLFAIGLEFFQLFRLTNGRFDPWDLAFYGIFWLIASRSFASEPARQRKLSPFTLDGFLCVASLLSVYLAHVSG